MSSKATYNKSYTGATWPGLNSGVTIGIGYDVGQTSAAAVKNDWSGLAAGRRHYEPDARRDRVGGRYQGQAARARAAALKGQVNVSYDAAMKVFSERDIPRWTAL